MSIKKIAEKAGLSKTTVSMILNKKDSPLSFSDETKKRVLEIARELNYQPNYQARSLSMGKTECIGIAGGSLWAMDNPATSQIYAGIGQIVQDHTYNMMFFPIGETNADDLMEKAVYGKMVDGLIVIVFSTMHESFNNRTLPILKKAGVPVVAIHSTTESFACHNVGFDSPRAGYLAAKHLADQGMKKVGFIGVRNRIYNDQLFDGYKEAMDEAGLPVYDLRYDSSWYVDSAETGYHFGKEFAASALPEGVVVFADCFAGGMISALEEAGKKVPRDLAVVGIDNVLKPAVLKSNLTTVDRKFADHGKCAGRILFEAIDKKNGGDIIQRLIEPELVVRGSSIR